MSRTPQIVPLPEKQILAAGQVLARAFFNDPLCVYTEPDLEARVSHFTWLFTQLVRRGARHNGVYTNTPIGRPDGVALWMPPDAAEPEDEAAVGSAMDQMEQRFGPVAYRRFTKAYHHFDRIHHQRIAGPHWYLALLGVSPHCQGRGIGRALLTSFGHGLF